MQSSVCTSLPIALVLYVLSGLPDEALGGLGMGGRLLGNSGIPRGDRWRRGKILRLERVGEGVWDRSWPKTAMMRSCRYSCVMLLQLLNMCRIAL